MTTPKEGIIPTFSRRTVLFSHVAPWFHTEALLQHRKAFNINQIKNSGNRQRSLPAASIDLMMTPLSKKESIICTTAEYTQRKPRYR
jgi:hypothetical protein